MDSTLLVIFGPLAADEVCARKRNDAVRMSSNEMTTRCRLAMLYIINYVRGIGVWMVVWWRTPVVSCNFPIKLTSVTRRRFAVPTLFCVTASARSPQSLTSNSGINQKTSLVHNKNGIFA